MGFFVKEVTEKKLTLKFKLLLFAFSLLLFYIFHVTIFEAAGKFLIAENELPPTADVILFEEEIVFKQGFDECYKLFNSKLCKEVFIVRILDTGVLIPEHKIETSLREVIDSIGMKFPFTFIPIRTEHPFTYNKSMKIRTLLEEKGYKNVILLTESFHSRRSFEVYKKILEGSDINLYVTTYYSGTSYANWWKSSNGFRRVVSEWLKYIYYMIKGYV